ncbi:hypothetical protein [Paenibacillus sp. UASWS1643]|nr:hypothetical protein [Paenibacillus sp. UASWS1643]RPK22753.1 hypothetical protein EDO6_05945 [Paenibacillus xylanexedens]
MSGKSVVERQGESSKDQIAVGLGLGSSITFLNSYRPEQWEL